jgi:hypothetical protein
METLSTMHPRLISAVFQLSMRQGPDFELKTKAGFELRRAGDGPPA